MASLLQLDPSRCAKELARALAAETAERQWQRAWRLVYFQCVALAVLGYAGYGASFALRGDAARVMAAASFVVAYVLPAFRLLGFFLRHAEEF